MQDKTLTCKDCGKQFVWTTGEQQFYQDKGFTNPPSRCPDCRKLKKNASMGNGGGPRQEFNITCSNCGRQDTVPFEPRGDKPVLCRDCYKANKTQSSAR
jgi:CxxC-x17-CxxC domain-containing protein